MWIVVGTTFKNQCVSRYWEEVEACPLIEVLVRDMEISTPGREISQHNTDVDRARKSASTKTTHGLRRDLREIYRRNNSRLPNPHTSNKSSQENLPYSPTICQEKDDTDSPHNAQLASSPESSNSITEDECTAMCQTIVNGRV